MNLFFIALTGALPRASTFAVHVDRLYGFLVAVAIFFTILIFGLVALFAYKFRWQSSNPVGVPIHGHTGLEIFWTVIPLILAMIMFAWGAILFFDMRRPPDDAMEIFVVGKQWMWKIQHPQGRREINELHVPVGRPVRLTLTSEDVIHSFFVPAFRVKMDVIPGRYTSLWFEATEPGKYHLFCAEYCGTEHSKMGGWVYAMEEAEYEEWVSGGKVTGGVVSQGEMLFEKFRCLTCHGPGLEALGPRLEGVSGRQVVLTNGRTVVADDNYLRESILVPATKVVSGYVPLMPAYKEQISEPELMKIIAYIKSLKKAEKGGESP